MASFSKTLKDLTPKQICIVMLISGWLLAAVYPPFDLLDTFRGLFGKERFGDHRSDDPNPHGTYSSGSSSTCEYSTKKCKKYGSKNCNKLCDCKWKGNLIGGSCKND